MKTSFKKKKQEVGTWKKTFIFEVPDHCLMEAESKNSEQVNLSGRSDIEGRGYVDGQDQVDKVLSGKVRWMNRSCTSETTVETCSTTDLSVKGTLKRSEIDTYSDKNLSWRSTHY